MGVAVRWVVIVCVGILVAVGLGAVSTVFLLEPPAKAKKTATIELGNDVERGTGGVSVGSKGSKEKKKSTAPKSSTDKGRKAAGAIPKPRSTKPPVIKLRRQEFEENEVVVANPPRGFAEKVATLGFFIVEQTRFENLNITTVRLTVPRGMTPPDATALLLREFPGLITDVNTVYDQSAGPAVKTHSFARWAIGWPPSGPGCGKGVKLGMIDSPVDVNHIALKGQKVEFKSFHNAKRKPGSANHGTAVAAMLVGKPTKEGFGGILPEATLFAANMFEIYDRGKTIGNAMGLLKSLDWLANKKPHAINLSVAGNNNKVIRLAFKKAREYKLIMIAAAGNWGVEKPAYPAAFKDVLAVTAVADMMKIYRKANRGDYIDFAAPGVRLWTAVPGGGKYQTGTSFASPYIAALAGLAIANGVKADPGSLRGVFKKNVVDLGDPGKDKTFGYGYVHLKQKCGT